jgi:Ca2+-binding RTX toxin-like protein
MDRLIGGQGGDMLTGGAGSVRDDFVFVSAADSRSGVLRRDTIFDFQVGLDKLDLSQIDSDTTKDGDQAFAFSGSEAAALSVWQVVGRSQTRILADTSGDAVADMDILLDDSVTLVATDFIL